MNKNPGLPALDMSDMPYLTRREVAVRICYSPAQVAHMAARGEGPRFVILGKRAMTPPSEVTRWLQEQADVQQVVRERTAS